MEDINKTLDDAIQNKEIKVIRNILTTSMVQDPGFNDGIFDKRLTHCLLAGIPKEDIFVPFEGEAINTNQSEWTKDYYAEQTTEFRYNFSHERLEHLRKVGGKLFPVERPVQPPPSSSPRVQTGRTPPPPPRSSPPRVRSNRGIKIAGGAVGGGVVGGTIAGIAGGSVFFGIVTGAVIAGAAVAIITTIKE
jgi:hypothetical protein